ncbi:hypothetical protein N7466_003077 [Penicillium verhagenii]|uniref:uncharacterized protein n=1 Tax=Penicillium verhagenii TaxID=1562060 RepID=UPI00254516D1|nr:uncharacterized protein N7466_003077 [Penicillium verhagenii]KAJ5936627.1 hypothetical protein N7466_003077 [Penicillium verhagenii]
MSTIAYPTPRHHATGENRNSMEKRDIRPTVRQWAPKGGLMGYFTHDRFGLLPFVPRGTDTEVRIEKKDGMAHILLESATESNISEAIKKLDRVAFIMNFTDAPYSETVVLAPGTRSLAYKIQEFSTLNALASQRVLFDKNISVEDFLRMQAPAAYHYSETTRTWCLLERLINPPCLRSAKDEHETTRDWEDFYFPERGTHILDAASSHAQSTPTGDVSPIEYPCSPGEKASDVTQLRQESKIPPPEEACAPFAPKGSSSASFDKTLEKVASSIARLGKKPTGVKRRVPFSSARDEHRKVSSPEPQLSVSALEARSPSTACPGQSGSSPIQLPSLSWRAAKILGIGDVKYNPLSQVERPKMPTKTASEKQSLKYSPLLKLPLSPTAVVFTSKTFEDHVESPVQEPKSPLRPTALTFTPSPKSENRSARSVTSVVVKNSDMQIVSLADLLKAEKPTLSKVPCSPVKTASPTPVKTPSPASGKKSSHTPVKTVTPRPVEQPLIDFSDFPPILPASPLQKGEPLKEVDLNTLGPQVHILKLSNGKSIAGHLEEGQAKSPTFNSAPLCEELGMSKERVAEIPRTPVLHFTMRQQASRNPIKHEYTESRAAVKARRDAAIMKAWGEGPSLKAPDFLVESSKPGPSAQSQAISKTAQKKQQLVVEHKEKIGYLFHAVEPFLDAATWFPGALSLEISFGFFLIYHNPHAAELNRMTAEDLKVYFDPHAGLSPPTCQFFDKVSTSPADVDYIINLKDGDRNLFARIAKEKAFQYEFHCSIGQEEFLVVIDQNGSLITTPGDPVPLGSVHLNIPGHIYDASLTLYGTPTQTKKESEQARQAAEAIAQSLFVEPDLTHIHMMLKKPKDVKIRKIFMRRSSYHRVLGQEIEIKSGNDGPDLFLHIKETQDLIFSMNDNDDVVTAHCGPLAEMVKEHRQWWCISIASPIINAVLARNAKVEPGDQMAYWKPTTLFGSDSEHLKPNAFPDDVPDLMTFPTESEIADEALISLIGGAGLGALVGLAEVIVKKIDAVGANNNGPAGDIRHHANPDGGPSNKNKNSSSAGDEATSDTRMALVVAGRAPGTVKW